MRIALGLLFMVCTQSLAAQVKIVPLQPTPFNDNVEIRLRGHQVIRRGDPLTIEYRSFPLGVQTFSESLRGMRRNPNGSTIVIIFNGKDRISVTDRDEVPMIEKKAYFDKELTKQLPRKLKVDYEKGKVIVTALALNAFNESIKLPSAMSVEVLDFENPRSRNKAIMDKLKLPYVLYIQPLHKFWQGEPVLLDFYLVNTDIGPDGNQVQLYIDGALAANLTSWTPYQIQNLEPGYHVIKLVLVNPKGIPLESPFPTPQEATIEIVPKK